MYKKGCVTLFLIETVRRRDVCIKVKTAFTIFSTYFNSIKVRLRRLSAR